MARRTKSESSGSEGSGNELLRIQQQIEAKRVEKAQLHLEDITAAVAHVKRVNSYKENIRDAESEGWSLKVEAANNRTKVQEIKTQDTSHAINDESNISGLKRTLANERITRMKRRIYEELEEIAE